MDVKELIPHSMPTSLHSRSAAITRPQALVKRAMDIAGAAIGLPLCAPLLAIMAVAIKLDSPGPVFFRQKRVGANGKVFTIYKLRTMVANAEDLLDDLIDLDALEEPMFKLQDDPRVTRLGRFLRRWSIDELPQLVNVLRGEMSLVGPRPERPYYVEQFRRSIPRYMDRHREKAGMTGWAAVNGLRGDTSIPERTKYDLWYTENWSLLLDIKILVRTILQFGSGKNAY